MMKEYMNLPEKMMSRMTPHDHKLLKMNDFRQNSRGYINIHGAEVKVFPDDKVIVVNFLGYTYIIDDHLDNQEVCVFAPDPNEEGGEPLKCM